MEHKSLIILFFLALTTQLWSQERLYPYFENKLFSDVLDRLHKTEADQSEKRLFNTNEFLFSFRDDSLNKSDTLRTSLINKAHNYIGVSYRYGQSNEKGFDCSGFVKYVFHFFGLELPHSSYGLFKLSKRIETTEARSGDLVFFITRGKGVSHVGIYLGNDQFIHSPGRGRSVSISSLSAGYYKKHLVGFGSVL
jgi:cell wall-associated NlpC family hydrolase